MKKVLLIEPGTRVTVYPPIGLLHIASVIRDNYDVVVKDYSGCELNEKQVENYLRRVKPFVIGVRVLTGPGIPRALLISKVGKRLGIPVIWGGPHPTILPEQTLENENVDAAVMGEGEYTIQDLLKYFEGKLKTVYGAGIKEKGKIKIFPPQKKVVNFKNLPMPAWDLLEDINRYFPEKRHNSLPISTTRGCAFKCGFCHNSNKNVNQYLGCYRIAEPERAIEEFKFVRRLVKNKIDYLDVGEDLHLISYGFAKKFCEAIRKSKIKNLKWNTATKYSMIDEKIVELIARHGCKRIMLGVESGSRRIQEISKKIVDLEHAKKIAKLLRKKKIFVTNTYIFGHPSETLEDLKMTLKYIKEIPADENLIQLYRPMPGTPYFNICLRDGKIKNLPKKTEEWSGFGVLGEDINVSKVPTKILFGSFYKINAWHQTKFLINQQRYHLREGMYKRFFKTFIENRFTHKLKEFLESKK